MSDKTLSSLAKRNFNWVEKMGWHNKSPLESIALIASEIGEAANECRGEHPTDKLGSELADIILRTVDLAETLEIDIQAECFKKWRLMRVKEITNRGQNNAIKET